ncbi:MAG: catalase [Ruminococcaceae bacterium]|nr:catalase [Oscillospiraceae bacterium]
MKILQHFKTITAHRHAVIRHCAKVGILWQGLRHDLSKYSPAEFLTGAKYYAGDKSPNVNERIQNGYSAAWMHHKGRNKHHFEYWTDFSIAEQRIVPVEMPLKYTVEMFCDRVAACKIYKGDKYTDRAALDYYNNGKDYRSIHPATAELLESWLVMLSLEGEEKTFAHIRELMQANKKHKR